MDSLTRNSFISFMQVREYPSSGVSARKAAIIFCVSADVSPDTTPPEIEKKIIYAPENNVSSMILTGKGNVWTAAVIVAKGRVFYPFSRSQEANSGGIRLSRLSGLLKPYFAASHRFGKAPRRAMRRPHSGGINNDRLCRAKEQGCDSHWRGRRYR
ncbi:hypothetical protein ACP26E_12645 [Franconibacter pulveris 601]|uniref:hypothetical protein n=1 Tax=Franconibacter pulveris TaxID=435910 RepID=UPI00142F3661|nr:hypothetical protein [Franconibacter pulveris]